MRPLQWYFDYEPKGYQPRIDRRLQNHQSRQQARREIAIEVEELARENAPESIAILACMEDDKEAERIRQEEDLIEFRRGLEPVYEWNDFDGGF